jgi:type VI protein secretion system component Hcp
VVVSAFQTGGSDDAEPVDQISLNYAKVELEYRPASPSGKPEAPVKAAWDLKANKRF